MPQETTGFEPFELLFGRSIRGPIQNLKELWSNDQAHSVAMNSHRYVLDLKERMEQTLKLIKEETQKKLSCDTKEIMIVKPNKDHLK